MGTEEEGQLADYVAYTIHVGQYTNTIHGSQYTPIQCMCAEGIGQDLNIRRIIIESLKYG